MHHGDGHPFRSGRRLAILCLAAAAISRPAGAWAEELPLLPDTQRPTAAPTQQDQRSLDERKSGNALPASGATTVAPSAGQGQALFLLRHVAISGSSAVPQAVLDGAVQDYVGRRVSLGDLQAMTSALSELYRAQGFHLTRAIIPPQDLASGVLNVSIVEGGITEIVVKGDDGAFGVASVLAPIAQERPSRRQTLESKLLLVNDRPGVRVTDTTIDEIVPSSGQFKLTVTVQTWRAYTAAGVDNLGSAAVGPWQASANAALNSIILPGDTLAISGSTVPNSSREMRFGRISYDAPIGWDNLRLGVMASTSHIWPGDQRRWYRTTSRADTYELRASYAPLLSQHHSLWLTGSIGLIDATEQNAYGMSYEDRFRVASIGADYKGHLSDGSWTYASATFKKALGFDGASARDGWISRFGASGHFSVFNGALTHYQNLIENWSLKLAAAGQVASGPLPISQQYNLGGNWFGRGLPGGWISGDNAIAGSAELRYDGSFNSAFAKGYQVYAFVDGGVTETKYEPRNLVQSIASVGAGVRVFITDEWQAGVGIAKPIAYRSPVTHDRGATLLFSLSYALRVGRS